MKSLLLIALLALAPPALASPYFPLAAGAVWTLADDDPVVAMTLTMAGEMMWHGAFCHPRYEAIDGTLVGITYWSTDNEGRALLHGLKYLVAESEEYYFNPPAVYLDPSLQPGESVTTPVNVFEVLQFADQWHGELALQVTCVDRDPVTTPLGTFPAVTVDPAWIDSPFGATWRYGHDGVFSFGYGVGPVAIASHASPDVLILVRLDNFVPTDVAPTAVTAQLDLRAAPNPFNPVTTLRFSLAIDGRARVEIFDLRGRRIGVLHDGPLPGGDHEFIWQPRNLESGVYLARVTTPHGMGVTRLTLVE